MGRMPALPKGAAETGPMPVAVEAGLGGDGMVWQMRSQVGGDADGADAGARRRRGVCQKVLWRLSVADVGADCAGAGKA